jgi:hypothetical protein
MIVEKIKIKNLFNKLEIAEKENEIKELPFPLKVKTPYGYNKIVTAFRTEKQKAVTTYFKNNTTLKTSENHLVKANGEWKKIKDLVDTDIVETDTGTTSIVRKHGGKEEILYDISVENVHCYYSNGIVSHNSWVLAKLGAEAMKQGKNVLHITLELNENYVGLRYDSCFTGIDFKNIRNNIDVVKQKIASVPGKLFIKYYPIKTVSANSIKLHAERIKMLGTPIDMIVVDYADILRPAMAEKNSNSYSEAGGIYEELRAVAGELQIPIWSASQANRSAAEEDVVMAHHAADSYRKIMTADFVMSLSRKTADKVNNTARIHIIKNRFGADGITFPCRMNAGCGDIQVFNESSKEGATVLNEMSQEENIVKKAMYGKYKSMMEDDNQE